MDVEVARRHVNKQNAPSRPWFLVSGMAASAPCPSAAWAGPTWLQLGVAALHGSHSHAIGGELAHAANCLMECQ